MPRTYKEGSGAFPGKRSADSFKGGYFLPSRPDWRHPDKAMHLRLIKKRIVLADYALITPSGREEGAGKDEKLVWHPDCE